MNIEVHVPPLKQEIGPFVKPESKKESQTKSKKNSQKESDNVSQEASQNVSQKESQKHDPKRALTRQEADDQRFTTAIRWIVEVIFKLTLTFFNLSIFRLQMPI